MSRKRSERPGTIRTSGEVEPSAPPGGTEWLVRVDGLSVGFESNVVLKEVSLDVPRRGVMGILGPAGVGKSTLLRTLGRWNDPLPSFWAHGRVWFEGREILRGLEAEWVRPRLALLVQKARLYTATILDNVIAEIRAERPLRHSQKRELAHRALAPLGLWGDLEPRLNEDVLSLPLGTQRKLSIARLLAGGAACLLADEPLRDLSRRESADLSAFLQRVAARIPVVMVTHNQREARQLCERICLLSAGRVIEVTPAEEFFVHPRTTLGAQFLEFGNCWPPAGDGAESGQSLRGWEPVTEETVPRPGGFHWVLVGRLGGMQQPGLLRDLEEDLEGLAQLGCSVLVSLTEESADPRVLERAGIRSEHFPIADMGVPTLSDAEALCRRVSSWIDGGTPTVFHCKAGLGRTGTMLACTLVYRGENPVRAVEQVRSINPFYIQSRAQLDFISRFGHHLAEHGLGGEPLSEATEDRDPSGDTGAPG